MTRSYYSLYEKQFEGYIKNHASTNPEAGADDKVKQIATFNKNALLSKINANMLIKCDEHINKIQVDEV